MSMLNILRIRTLAQECIPMCVPVCECNSTQTCNKSNTCPAGVEAGAAACASSGACDDESVVCSQISDHTTFWRSSNQAPKKVSSPSLLPFLLSPSFCPSFTPHTQQMAKKGDSAASQPKTVIPASRCNQQA
jgi:hypothetical protein